MKEKPLRIFVRESRLRFKKVWCGFRFFFRPWPHPVFAQKLTVKRRKLQMGVDRAEKKKTFYLQGKASAFRSPKIISVLLVWGKCESVWNSAGKKRIFAPVEVYPTLGGGGGGGGKKYHRVGMLRWRNQVSKSPPKPPPTPVYASRSVIFF